MTTVATSNMVDKNYPKGVAMVLFAGCLWSIAGVVIRFIEGANEWQILFYRSLALMATLFFFIGFRFNGPLRKAYTNPGIGAVIAGACLSLAFACWIFAMTHTTIANALFILASAPFLTAIIARFMLGETVRKLTIVCMSVAAFGILIMVVEGILEGALLGNIFALGAALGFSFFTVLLRKTTNVEMTPAVFWAGFWGVLLAGVMILVTNSGFTISRHDFELCSILGFVQVGLGLIIYTMGSKYVPAAELALLSLTEVILGPVWVWLGVGEIPSFYTMLGGAIVLGAIVYQAIAGIRSQRLIMAVPH